MPIRFLDGANDALPRPFRGPMRFGLLPATAAFSPASLFAAGEEGVWYDPSDLTTLYQDHLGTIPAAYGQPVGLMLDKSKGLVRGPNSWNDAAVSVLGASERVSGNAYRVRSTDGAYAAIGSNGSTAVGKLYEVSFTIDAVTIPGGGLQVGNAGTIYSTVGEKRTVFVGEGGSAILKRVSGVTDIQVSNISVREIPGNHASQPTVTARPTLMQDAGGRAYLQFDGVDDCLAVPAFDWGSDKAAIVAGVRRIGTSIAALLELNDLNNGNSFAVLAPQSSGNTMQFGTHGPAGAQYELHNYVDNAAPSTAVWSAQFDRAQGAGAEISVRRNGVVGGTNARADNTTGNFGNHPLHIGARSGSSLFFNGHLYSLAAVNRLMTPDEMGKLETYAAQKTGVTL